MTKGFVYEFLNADGEVIYVGSTHNIKGRIRSHFYTKDNGKMQEDQYGEVESIRYMCASSRPEAYIIETYLINKLCPKYNTRMSDDADIQIVNIDVDSMEWDELPEADWKYYVPQERNKSEWKYPPSSWNRFRLRNHVYEKATKMSEQEYEDYCNHMPWKVAMKLSGLSVYYDGHELTKLKEHINRILDSEFYCQIKKKWEDAAHRGEIDEDEVFGMIFNDLVRNKLLIVDK